MSYPGHPKATVYWLPTIPLTPVDIVNRRAAATGSMSYARATGDADYNGHWINVSFKPHAVSGPTWNAEYHWGERVVLARGSFDRCIAAAREEYARGAHGCTVRVYLSSEAPETLNEQHDQAERLGFLLHTEASEKARHSLHWTGKHAAVSDALHYERHFGAGLVSVALEFEGTTEDWPAVRDTWLTGTRRPTPQRFATAQ